MAINKILEEWTNPDCNGSKDFLKIDLGISFPSLFVSIQAMAKQSQYYKRILEIRTSELEICLEQFEANYGYMDVSNADARQRKAALKDDILKKMMDDLSCF